MTETTPLQLFNSLTRRLDPFVPVHAGEARVYSCGPTVYNYPHIGNMRAYVFADTLGRTLSYKGFALTHVINITDVGHLTDDGDTGEDKMEKMAAERAQSIWDIAEHYKQAYWADVQALNIRQPARWTIATDYVPQMIAFAQGIAEKHCYELPSGLYFDVSTVADYGRLARVNTDDGESRIDPVEGKRNAADFAIWRRTPEGEKRQMEWDSPWGRGAPGWHLECSVMSGEVLGFPFDIHTGGIDHREIHHPNEIAQNQAHCCTGGLTEPANSGARIWMHNNFLIERSGKMSKSAGEFLRLQLLIDRGFHPLAYRLMCLQAHYRPKLTELMARFDAALCDDLNTAVALTLLDEAVAIKKVPTEEKRALIEAMDAVLGLGLFTLGREALRVRPKDATLTDAAVEELLTTRKTARAEKDFAASDAIRDQLVAAGIDVMDGDPLRWDWKPIIPA
jgi:cysteinyl-tRNA synthetase